MEFKKTRIKQVLTAIKTVRESFKQLEEAILGGGGVKEACPGIIYITAVKPIK